MQRLLLILSVLFLSTACSNFHMEKRRYNKGFHISFNKNRLNRNTESSEKNFADVDGKSTDSHEITAKDTPKLNLAPKDSLIPQSDLANETNSTQTSNSETKRKSRKKEEIERKGATKEHSEKLAIEAQSSSTVLKSTDRSKGSALWYFALLGVLPILLTAKKTSYNMGTWASANVSKARFAMAGLYALGATSSFLIGNMWQPAMEQWMLAIPLSIAGSVLINSAVKKKQKTSFIKKRLSYAAVNMSSFFGSFALGAQAKFTLIQTASPEVQDGLGPVAATLLTLLLIVAMTAAVLGLAILACNLACSGYGILALVVMAGGSFLTMFFGTWAILGAIRGRSRNRDNVMTALIIGIIAALLILVPIGISAIL